MEHPMYTIVRKYCCNRPAEVAVRVGVSARSMVPILKEVKRFYCGGRVWDRSRRLVLSGDDRNVNPMPGPGVPFVELILSGQTIVPC